MNRKTTARPDIGWLRAFTFTIYGTSVLVSSYFPLFYAQLGFSTSQIGLLYALGPMISLVSNLLWSLASDRYQTIKKILLILLVGQIALTFILSASTTFSIIMAVITVFYFFFYPVFPLSDTIVISTAKQHGIHFISIRLFGSFGYAFFALLIGYVLARIGSSNTMWVSIAIAGLALAFILFVKDQPTSVAKMDLSGIWAILRQKELLWFFGCVFCLAIGMRMNEAFISISLKELGAGENLIGWAMLASSLSEIPVFIYLSFHGEKFKELPLLLLASLLFAVRFLLMGLTESAYGILAIQAMHGVTFGIFYVTAIRMLTRLIPDEFRATGMALYTIVWSSLAGLLSGTFGGVMFEQLGRQPFYLTAMGAALVAFIGFASRYFQKGPGANTSSKFEHKA
ncbi:MAG: MFS transporter [Paenibacillus sp.]|uniref:MFS transporter n=1 Tax=Paenibacillus sp. TaxID=58172 RepID=UPI002901A1C4|nr:MFS transporter [Paenibacillus sp.]MDU2239055.1 MFS transporter [Paenibacillus sp.]